MCANVPYIGKAKIKFRHRLNNYKTKYRPSKKRSQIASQKLFHKHYCLDGHTAIDNCDFLLLERCEMYKQLKERDMF